LAANKKALDNNWAVCQSRINDIRDNTAKISRQRALNSKSAVAKHWWKGMIGGGVGAAVGGGALCLVGLLIPGLNILTIGVIGVIVCTVVVCAIVGACVGVSAALIKESCSNSNVSPDGDPDKPKPLPSRTKLTANTRMQVPGGPTVENHDKAVLATTKTKPAAADTYYQQHNHGLLWAKPPDMLYLNDAQKDASDAAINANSIRKGA
jgi:hypothetical protein